MPYSPITGKKADSTNPMDCGTYGQALQFMDNNPGSFNGLGFVLSAADPYTIIDLDDPTGVMDTELAEKRILTILEQFKDTYIERSPSGHGFHIIVRGSIPNGRRLDPIEMYTQDRYFTMTGDTYADNPIIEHDYNLLHLHHALGGAAAILEEFNEGSPETADDEQVYRMGCAAVGDKNPGEHFRDLFHGHWHKWHDNQSSADMALVNMLGFFSRNPDQMRRMFLTSELGKRAKAHRGPSRNKKLGYLDEMIQKSFDNLPPEIDIDMLMGNLDGIIAQELAEEKANPTPMLGTDWELPPGLIGLAAEFFYHSAPRPVKEMALAAAIALVAGVAGRAYNISNTGLNYYILAIAQTGCGKEAMKGGISRLIRAVTEDKIKPVPVAREFIGPADIASGPALIKYLATNKSFVSIVGEFGIALQQMCQPNAPSSQVTLRKVILDLYNKSGINDDLGQTVYSDKDKNTSVIKSPAFSILGESSPDLYYPNLDERMFGQGLIPRFTVIEYTGNRPRLNKAHAFVKPGAELVQKLSDLMTNSLLLQQNNRAVDVTMHPDAEEAADTFDRYCDERHHGAESEVGRHLWSRGHVKVLKLAALIAVGIQDKFPVVTVDHIAWARKLVEADITNIIARFESGRVGSDSNEQQQIIQLIDAVRDYILRPYDVTMLNYGVKAEFHRDKVLPWSYISRRLLQKPAFKNDRNGARNSLKRTVAALIDDGALVKINAHVVHQRYEGSSAELYAIGDFKRFSGQ
jgi:hypothetical protein